MPDPTPRRTRRPFRTLNFEPLEDRTAPAVFTVTTTADTGPGSLRQAIADANAAAGADEIRFNIPGGGVHTIRPTTSLPDILDTVVIDGYTQPGASPNTNPLALGSGALGTNAVLKIEIDGSLRTSGGNGLLTVGQMFTTAARGTVIRGLVVNNSNSDGIAAYDPEVRIEGNFIGTDPTGTIARPNRTNGVGNAYWTVGTVVGGTTPAARNLISGNTGAGVYLQYSHNRVLGNFIGTDATGMAKLANGANGVFSGGLGTPTNDNRILGNLISGNFYAGISANWELNGVIQGNYVGTDRTGTAAIGNGANGVFSAGIQIDAGDAASSILIGGPNPADRNVVSGNGGTGIFFRSVGGTGHTLTIENNFVGLQADGVSPLGNTHYGLWDGIVAGGGTWANGIATIRGNRIAHNGYNGVFAGTPGVTITQNSLYSNGGIGVDHGSPGVTPQPHTPHPVLESVVRNGGNLDISGRIQGQANTEYTAEFFSSAARDPSGYGEGQTYLGSVTVTTDASGLATFTGVSVPNVEAQQLFITATATNTTTKATFEFSQAHELPPDARVSGWSAELFNGVSLTFDGLPRWAGLFDASGLPTPSFELPVLTSDIGSLFGIPGALATLYGDLADFTSDTTEALRTKLEAAGFTIDHIYLGLGGIPASPMGKYIQVRYRKEIATLAVNPEFNRPLLDNIGEVLEGVGDDTELSDDELQIEAKLVLELVMGVDEDGGFYLSDDSSVLVEIDNDVDDDGVAEGAFTGTSKLLDNNGAAVGEALEGTVVVGKDTGDEIVPFVVRVRPDEIGPIRVAQLAGIAGQLHVRLDGDVVVDVAVQTSNVKLDWHGVWVFTPGVEPPAHTTSLEGRLTVPALTRNNNGEPAPAEFVLVGAYGGAGWHLEGEGEVDAGYKLHGYEVKELSFEMDITDAGVDAFGAGILSVILAGSLEPTEIGLGFFLDNELLVIDSEIDLPTSQYVGPDHLLWVSEGFLSFHAEANFAIGDESFAGGVTFRADEAILLPEVPLGSAAPSTGKVRIFSTEAGEPAITGSVDTGGRFALTAANVTATVGPLTVTGTGVAVNVRDFGVGDITPYLFVEDAAVALPVGGQTITLTATDLTLSQAEKFTITSAELSADEDLLRTVGLGGLLPLTVRSVSISGGEVIDLDDFYITVTGTFDFSVFDGLPARPVIGVGGRDYSAVVNPNEPFALAVRVDDGRAQVIVPGPITLGFEDWHAGPLTLGATVTLGEYVNGEFVSSVGATVRVESSSGPVTAAQLDFTGALEPNSRGGVDLDLRFVGTVSATLPGDVLSVENLTLTADLNLSFDGDMMLLAPPALTLRNGSVDRLTVTLGEFMTFEATAGIDFQAEGAEAFFTLERGSIAFPSLEVLPGGAVENVAITADGDLKLLPGATFELTIPDELTELVGLGKLPFTVDALGVQFNDVVDGVVRDLADFSVLFSGMIGDSEAEDGKWPFTLSVENLEIDLGALRDGEYPIKPESLTGVSITVPKFKLGDQLEIGGTLSFDVAEAADGRKAVYVVIGGEFTVGGIGAGLTLAIGERGPVAATVSAPLAVPLGPSGLILTGVDGGLFFGQTIGIDTSLPANDLLETAAVPDFFESVVDLDAAVLAALDGEGFTWTLPLTVVLRGTLTIAIAPGIVSGSVALGATIDPATPIDSLRLFGTVDATLFGMADIAAGLAVLDFTSLSEPVLFAKLELPPPGSLLQYVLPLSSSVVLKIDTKGLAPALAEGLKVFVNRAVGGTLDLFFRDALEQVRADVASSPNGVLGTLLEVGPVPPATVGALADLILDALDDADRVGAVAQQLLADLFGAMDRLLREPGAPPVPGDLGDFAEGVIEFFDTDARRTVLALVDVLKDAFADAAGTAAAIADPSLTFTATVKPTLFGVSLGPDIRAADFSLSKRGILVGIDLDPLSLWSLQHLGPLALLLQNPDAALIRQTLDAQFPFKDAFLDLARGRLPEIDPGANWLLRFTQTFNLGTVAYAASGVFFPGGDERLLRRVFHVPGSAENESGLELAVPVIVPSEDHFDRLVAGGGVLLDGSIYLHRLVSDPGALFEDIAGSLPDPLADPVGFAEAFLGRASEVDLYDHAGQAQLFIPNVGADDGYFVGRFTGKVLGLELVGVEFLATVENGAPQYRITGAADLLGLVAVDVDVDVGRSPQGKPRAGFEASIDSTQFAEVMDENGFGFVNDHFTLPTNFTARVRGYTPGFDTASTDPLQVVGGIELSGELDLNWAVEWGGNRFTLVGSAEVTFGIGLDGVPKLTFDIRGTATFVGNLFGFPVNQVLGSFTAKLTDCGILTITSDLDVLGLKLPLDLFIDLTRPLIGQNIFDPANLPATACDLPAVARVFATVPERVARETITENGKQVLEVTVHEGNPATGNVTIPITFHASGHIPEGESITLKVVPNTATATASATEFSVPTGKLQLTHDATSRRATVTIVADSVYELPEQFDIQLSVGSSSGMESVTLMTNTVRVRVKNDDPEKPANTLLWYDFDRRTANGYAFDAAGEAATVTYGGKTYPTARPLTGVTAAPVVPTLVPGPLLPNPTNTLAAGAVATAGVPKWLPAEADVSPGMVATPSSTPFEFTLTLVAPGISGPVLVELPPLAIDFWTRRTGAAPTTWELRWSYDNFGAVIANGATGGARYTRVFDGLDIPRTLALGTRTITFRLTGLGGSGGEWAIDNLALVVPVPAPIQVGSDLVIPPEPPAAGTSPPVVNTPPTAAPIAVQVPNGIALVTIGYTAVVSDAQTPDAALAVTVTQPPAGRGTVDILPGSLRLTLQGALRSSFSFTYTVADPGGLRATATVSVTFAQGGTGTVLVGVRSSRVADATVFVDADGDGLPSEGEPVGVTDGFGNTVLSLPPDVDLNGNGLLDEDEGTLVSLGGVRGTGGAVLTPMAAPGGSAYISPLSTLTLAVMAQGDLGTADAAALIRTRLGLPALDFLAHDVYALALAGNPGAGMVYDHWTVWKDTSLHLATLLAGTAEVSLADASRATHSAYAGMLLDPSVPVALTDPAEIRELASRLLGGTGVGITAYQSDTVGALVAAENRVTLGLEPPAPPPPPVPPPGLGTPIGTRAIAVGADAGSGAVRVLGPDGAERLAVEPFPGFAGGVRVAVADFNRDGVEDLVVGTGPGRSTRVVVIDGATQRELFSIDPFEAAFQGGVYVAAGDLTGDGIADLVVTPDEGGGPRVQVYSGSGFGKVADFFGIDDPNFRGGARAALGDITGDGRADLVLSAGFGGGPRVSVYDGAALAAGEKVHPVADFFLFEPALRNGAFVAVGDVDGDGFGDIVGGGGPGGGPRVYALSGQALLAGRDEVVANFFAGDATNRGGVRVAVKDLDGDAKADVVVGDGAGAGSRVTGYLGKDFGGGGAPESFGFDAFPGVSTGVFVG
ncbi:FG-GAP-like repeat-containing protein [Urbifossiella limnaea]|uniref:FG-GAP repeat protein n=1 Tax=Urbifossiella limnaea TaxID=2528023 RepID=A0A517Y295_9BACT|nr:FG-GAP-like repeat-containing protein [Urbifossiella limnaea]QDU23854.1 FG-GAP repeat protein [Urbifossiella limnaea]